MPSVSPGDPLSFQIDGSTCLISMEKVNLQEKLDRFQDYWHPRIVGELNGQHVKLAKLKGEFVWHSHDEEDELFLVLEGAFTMEFRDRTVHLAKGEFLIVPRGIEHRPVAENEVSILLFEPVSTVNTGNSESNLTRKNLEHL